MAQQVKNLPVMQEIWVQSLDQEDPLEEGMATHSGILTWRIPWTEEPGGLQSVGSQSWTQLKAMAPHSRTFAWKIPWTEKPGRLQSMGSLESDMTE